jgi:phosphoribosylaminoimidazole-succinocarboxamide synthase
MREQLIKKVDIIPLEVICRNVAAGSMSKRLGIEEGEKLPRPIVEFCLKRDDLGDPLIAEEHVTAFGWATTQEMDEMIAHTLRINDFLCGLFYGIGIKLVDFKIEFGRHFEGDTVQVLLADEISPDSCRLWDLEAGKKLDKDRFRRDLGDVTEAYAEVATRLGILKENPGAVTKLSVVKSEE